MTQTPPAAARSGLSRLVPRGPKGWTVTIISVLSAFGVFSAIGSYYIPGLLGRIGGGPAPTATSPGQVTPTTPAAVPLDFDVVLDRTETPNYIFASSLDPASVPIATLENDQDFRRWANGHGGVLADLETVRIILRGREQAVVHVDSINIKVVGRTTPRSGWYNGWDGCGGVAAPRVLAVDFDKQPPGTRWLIEGEPATAPSFTVSSTEEEVIDIEATSLRDEVRWVVEVRYSALGQDGVLQIDNGGQPFVVSTIANAQAYVYAFDGQPMRRTPDRDASAGVTRPPC
jgi:hypothetical protein